MKLATHLLPWLLPLATPVDALAQGSLTPPGPPAPTMKALDQVEPRTPIDATHAPGDADSLFRITESGSYYLTGNVSGEAAKHGIEIASSDVSLDLMGFTLQGVPGSLDGVFVASELAQVSVANGTIRDWDDDGVDALSATNVKLRDLDAAGNAKRGLVAGRNAVISSCAAYLNGEFGIVTAEGSVITNCIATNNSGIGISGGRNCAISDSVVRENGSIGIFADFAGVISRSSAYDNTLIGIGSLKGGTIIGCSVRQNGMSGISADDGSSVIDCAASANQASGITVASDCIARGNTYHNNGFFRATAPASMSPAGAPGSKPTTARRMTVFSRWTVAAT